MFSRIKPPAFSRLLQAFHATAFGILLLSAPFLSAQDRGQSAFSNEPRVSIAPRVHREGPRSNLRADVNVVQIPVTVTDPSGAPVTGLSRDQFRIFEDGIEQPLAHLSSQDAPLSLGIIFDASASMDGKLNSAREAVAKLADPVVPGDEFFVVQFSDAPKLIQGFTPDPGLVRSALQSVRADGWTALFDAIRLSIDQLKKAHNPRHALVVLSDGADNNSRFTEHEIVDLLRESDVMVFAIAINGPMVAPASFKVLKKIAESTGGRMYQIDKVSQLPDAVGKINRALRDQYTLSYYPTNTRHDGKYHRILVKIIPPLGSPSLRASWRRGYYAP
jgi:Ca-activated chloride channel family protein